MKIKIQPEDTSGLRENGWFQTDGWLAELRDDGRADPPGMPTPDRTASAAPGQKPSPRLMPSPRPAPALRLPPALT